MSRTPVRIILLFVVIVLPLGWLHAQEVTKSYSELMQFGAGTLTFGARNTRSASDRVFKLSLWCRSDVRVDSRNEVRCEVGSTAVFLPDEVHSTKKLRQVYPWGPRLLTNSTTTNIEEVRDEAVGTLSLDLFSRLDLNFTKIGSPLPGVRNADLDEYTPADHEDDSDATIANNALRAFGRLVIPLRETHVPNLDVVTDAPARAETPASPTSATETATVTVNAGVLEGPSSTFTMDGFVSAPDSSTFNPLEAAGNPVTGESSEFSGALTVGPLQARSSVSAAPSEATTAEFKKENSAAAAPQEEFPAPEVPERSGEPQPTRELSENAGIGGIYLGIPEEACRLLGDPSPLLASKVLNPQNATGTMVSSPSIKSGTLEFFNAPLRLPPNYSAPEFRFGPSQSTAPWTPNAYETYLWGPKLPPQCYQPLPASPPPVSTNPYVMSGTGTLRIPAGTTNGTVPDTTTTYSGTISGPGNTATYSGTTTVFGTPRPSYGAAQPGTQVLNFDAVTDGPGNSGSAVGTGTVTVTLNAGTNTVATGTCVADAPSAPRTAPASAPSGPVFYIIVEGAGLGDSVRVLPCTGKQTVLSALSAVSGISQVSSKKIWIARPSAKDRTQSKILKVDWEAIAKRGIETTNYTLEPNDRLVVGQDPVVTQSNLQAKTLAPVERLMGMTSLMTSVRKQMNKTPGAAVVAEEMARMGFLGGDKKLIGLLHMLTAGAQPQAVAVPPAAAPLLAPRETPHHAAAAEKPAAEKADGPPIVKLELPPTTKLSAAPPAAAHELAMQPLPEYRLEPPDLIQVEVLKIVPLPPYRAAVFDILIIRALNVLADQPIDNYYMVTAEGTINLGPAYGAVRVAGKTLDEIKTAIDKKLREILTRPEVSVELARAAGAQPVTGQYLVGPDGTINLKNYGIVHVSGKTVREAAAAIKEQLQKQLAEPQVAVDVVAYNSKVFYIVLQGAGLGDSVRRLPITGKETVLDAIAQVNGLSQVSSTKIWIARPMPNAAAPQKLPIDWDAISRRAETKTNYQILPGDRVYVSEDPQVTQNNLVGKKAAALERAMGLVSLTNSVVEGLNKTPGADAAVNELLRRGFLTQDEEVKQILLDAVHRAKENRPNRPNPKASSEPGREK